MTDAERAIANLPAAARASLPDRLAAVFDDAIRQLRAAGVAIDARASLAALVAEIVRDASERAINPFAPTSSRSESEWIERPIFVAPPSPPASLSALLARARSAAAAAVSAVVSPAGARPERYSPALIAAVTRGGAAARPDLSTTRAALSSVPASVRDFSAIIARARGVIDARKRSRMIQIGAVVVGAVVVGAVVLARKGGR
jgi:hypothetical protein